MIYVPGLLTGQLSGKAGHNVASKNPFASTIAVQRKAAVSQSPKVAGIRGNMAGLVALYKTMTTVEIQAWKDLGATMFVTGRLNRTFSLTAPAAFLSVNRNLQSIGGAPTTTAPALVRPPSAIVTSLTAVGPAPGPASILIELGSDPLDADTAVVIYGQVLRSGSIFTPPARSWRIVQVLAPSSSGPWDITADYISVCGAIAAGQTIWVKSAPISLEGFAGAGSPLSAIVS